MRRERGQAAIELVLLAPFVVAAMLACLQVVLLAWAQVEAADAARAGTRAGEVGADARAAALDALPRALRPGARVAGRGSPVVRLRAPAVVPGVDLNVEAGR